MKNSEEESRGETAGAGAGAGAEDRAELGDASAGADRTAGAGDDAAAFALADAAPTVASLLLDASAAWSPAHPLR